MTDDLPGGPASETERTMMAQKLDRAGRNESVSDMPPMKIPVEAGARKLLSLLDEPASDLTWPAEYRIMRDEMWALIALARLGLSVAFPTDEVIEEAARAIVDARVNRATDAGRISIPEADYLLRAWDEDDSPRADAERDAFRNDARAALAALQEGTKP